MRRLTERLLNEFYSELNSAFIEKFRKGGGASRKNSEGFPVYLFNKK